AARASEPAAYRVLRHAERLGDVALTPALLLQLQYPKPSPFAPISPRAAVGKPTLLLILGNILRRRLHGDAVLGAGDGGHLARLGEGLLGDLLQVFLAVLVGQNRVTLVSLRADLVTAPVDLGHGVVIVDVGRLRRVVDAIVVVVRRLGDHGLIVVRNVVIIVRRTVGPGGVVILAAAVMGAGERSRGGPERDGEQEDANRFHRFRDSSLISTRLSRDFTLCLSGLRLRLAVFDGF